MAACAVALMVTTAPSRVFAQTVTWDGGGGDGLLTTAANWTTDTLPTGGVSGILNSNAQLNVTALDDYDITQTAGSVTPSGVTRFGVGTGSYIVDGAAASIGGFRDLTVGSGGSLLLLDGTVNITANGGASDSVIAGSLAMSNGTLTVGRRLNVNGGMIEISGGTVSNIQSGGTLGGNHLQSGDIFLNGGQITFPGFQAGRSSIDLFFGGTAEGNFTVENFKGTSHSPGHIDIDFAPGTLMSMTLTDPVESGVNLGWSDVGSETGLPWAEALWADGRLTFGEQTYATLGSWNVVTNSGGLGDFNRFDFVNNTLSRGVGAPPAGNGYKALLMMRRSGYEKRIARETHEVSR